MRLYEYLQRLPGRIIRGVENKDIPLSNYFFTFMAAVFLRHFFEAYSQTDNYLNLPSMTLALDMIHFALSYIMIAMLFVAITQGVIGVSLDKVMRVVLAGFVLINFAPLFDLLITMGSGFNIKYMLPEENARVLRSYFTYGSGYSGISLGMKTEILIALVGCYVYARVKRASVIRSIFFVWLIYTAIFVCGASPLLLKPLLEFCGYTYHLTGDTMIHFYLVVNFLIFSLLAYSANHQIVNTLINDMRISRIIFYELMLVLGAALAIARSSQDLYTLLHFVNDSVINIVLAMISVLFASGFSIITNNIADIEIDRISNAERPLVSGVIDIKQYRFIGYLFLSLALFYAAMIKAQAFLIICVTIASYYLYSMPPLRLKRITLLSKLAIAMSALALTVLGYCLMVGYVFNFPKVLFLIYLVGFTVAANVIDLKDIAGDRKVGVLTLPILIGEAPTRRLVGLAFWATYVAFFYVLNNVYMLPLLIVAGGLQFYLINRNPYRERPIFIFNNVCIVALIALLAT